MPRYFFDVLGRHGSEDMLGVDLEDETTAHTEAVQLAGTLISDRPDSLTAASALEVHVRDAAGRQLLVVRMMATLPAAGAV